MESPSPQQHLISARKRAIDELIRGRQFASTLQSVLVNTSLESSASVSADHQELVSKILGSFCETLSLLSSAESDEISLVPLAVNSHFWDGRRSEDSSESCKRSATSKDRRGCYKRRKTFETSSKETSSLVDDGHAWRKYGQKVILNAQHPRNYFRCTHKFDQGCPATKQVQMIQENPPLFRTTYHGRHTCKNLLKAPQIILDNTTARDSSVILSFDQSNKPNNNENRHVTDSFMGSVFPLTKQETEEEVRESLLKYSTTSCDYSFLSPALTSPMRSALSGGSSGVYSCNDSTHDSLEMDNYVIGCVDSFDDVLQYDL